jgi:endonuclease YncB( thermonuclease family)
MSVPATIFLIFLLPLLTGANLSSVPQSSESKKKLSTEYEKECGNPLAENMSWKSIDGKVVEVLKGDAIILLMANNERKHVSLAGVNSASSLAAQALLFNLILDREVSVLVNPSNIAAKEVRGVVHHQARDINLELIKEGVARYQAPPPYSMSNYTACVYRIAEKQARQYGTGIWAQEQDREYAALGIQGSKFFRDKLGKPSELYRHTSGIDVKVNYDDKGQVCSVSLSDPARRRFDRSASRLMVVADELIPNSLRGNFVGRTGEIGNCINVEYKDYERVFIEINENACYEQSVRILFKRRSCPKPPQVPGLTTWQ